MEQILHLVYPASSPPDSDNGLNSSLAWIGFGRRLTGSDTLEIEVLGSSLAEIDSPDFVRVLTVFSEFLGSMFCRIEAIDFLKALDVDISLSLDEEDEDLDFRFDFFL